MKAMTLYQPWASLVAEGVKVIETRPREHPWRSAIGQTIAIHASKRPITEAACALPTGFHRGTRDSEIPQDVLAASRRFSRVGDLPYGAVLAVCVVADVLPITESWGQTDCVTLVQYTDGRPNSLAIRRGADGERIHFVDEQHPYGDYQAGRYAILLSDVRKVAPFPCRGYQGLWTLPDEVANNLVSWAA